MPQCMSRDPRKRRVCFLASSNGARQPRHGCRRRPEVAARMRRPRGLQRRQVSEGPNRLLGRCVQTRQAEEPGHHQGTRVRHTAAAGREGGRRRRPDSRPQQSDGAAGYTDGAAEIGGGVQRFRRPARRILAGRLSDARYARAGGHPKGCIAGRLDSEAGPRCQAQKPWAAVLSRHTKTTGWRRGLLPIAQRCLAFR